MGTLKIWLLGAPGSGRQQLAEALTNSLLSHGWLVSVRVTDDITEAAAQDLMLLMGLDAVTGFAPEADRSIRAALSAAAVAYDVLYGSHEELHSQALLLVQKRLTETGMAGLPSSTTDCLTAKAKPWVWLCDNCSDPQCEHRMLSTLLASRLTEPTQGAVAGGQGG